VFTLQTSAVLRYLSFDGEILCLGTTAFRGKFFQIPLASLPNTAANFPPPQKPTKYAVFVADKINIFNICHVRTPEAVMYLIAQ